MIEDKYVGLLLAITSSFAIGSSYVLAKKGLQDASERHGFEGDGHQYFKSPIWWGGIITMAVGEIANFSAYAFAPAILVTPLGALSVLSGAVLGAYFLGESLGKLGRLGCFICILGSVIIASHAPPDEQVETVDKILDYAIKPGRTQYCCLSCTRSLMFLQDSWHTASSLRFLRASWCTRSPLSTEKQALYIIFPSAQQSDRCL